MVSSDAWKEFVAHGEFPTQRIEPFGDDYDPFGTPPNAYALALRQRDEPFEGEPFGVPPESYSIALRKLGVLR
jgi:hypothetical protein